MPKFTEMLYLLCGVGKISETPPGITGIRDELKKHNIKILQLNMHRGKVAFALLSRIVRERKVDVAVISEQHASKNSGF